VGEEEQINQVLICPICKQSLKLALDVKSLQCASKHNYDITKQGYVNLLLANQKKTKSPGDNQMMITARRAFLEAGYYDPLVTYITKTISDLKLATQNTVALDLGCGEGHYAHQALSKSNKFKQILGSDISKPAVKLAARKYKNIDFFVSSAFNLPIRDESIDCILSVFAPLDTAELNRIAKGNGWIVLVSAGENHMKQIAEMIYQEFRPHSNNTGDKLTPDFSLTKSQQVTFPIELSTQDSILNQLKMTPYYWNQDADKLSKFKKLESLTVTCDFKIEVFQKQG